MILKTTHQPKTMQKNMNASNTHSFYLIHKTIKSFAAYTKFPVKKINVGKILNYDNSCFIILPINILKLESFRVLRYQKKTFVCTE
jgi:hypothetical protein